MAINIESIYNKIDEEMPQLGTILSFADNGDGRTLITIDNPPMPFIRGNVYTILNSYVYTGTYLILSPTDTTFIIDTPYLAEATASIPFFDVTLVYSVYIQVKAFTDGISCLDGNVNIDAIIELLILSHFSSQDNVKSIGARSHTTLVFDTLGRNTDNVFWKEANTLSDNCLINYVTQPTTPLMFEVVGGCY